MSEALFYAIIRSIVTLFKKRAEETLKPIQGLPAPPPPEYVGDLLTPLVWEARKQAWAAAALFLRGQARRHGAAESWIPPQAGYSPDTVRRTIRDVRGNDGTPEGYARLSQALQSHVLAAARRTVADAIDTAPDSVPLLEGALKDLDEDLKEFSPDTRAAIKQDIKKVERRPRPSMSFDEAFDKIAERVEEAVRTLDEDDLIKRRHRSMGVFSDVPDKYRRDRRGNLIVRPYAFARVCHPNKNGPCGFCAMLASRGPVYKTSQSAGQRADKFHRNCFCTVVPVFTSRTWEGKEQQVDFARVYNEVVRNQDLHGPEARKAMDKYFRQQLKERKA